MRKISIINHTLDDHDFGDLSKTESNPRARARLVILHQFSIGVHYTQVAKNNSVSNQTAMRIRRNYWESGLSSIYDKVRSGRNSKLAPEYHDEFKALIVKTQEEKKGGRLTGEDIAELARLHYGVEYHRDSIYRLLERLKMSWISGRSRHPKSDEAVQDEFKKNSSKM